MFIRQRIRSRSGQRHVYRALVESYRTATGLRQRVVAWLGKLDEAGRLGVKHAADAFGDPSGMETSGTADASVQNHPKDGRSAIRLSQPLNHQLQFEFDDEPCFQPRWVEVNAAGVSVENLRQFGGPWMALHLIRSPD